MNGQNKKKSPFLILEFIIVILMILAIAFMITIYFSFRETGAAPKIFGYYIYHTHAVNMAPKIPAGTAVFAKESEKNNVGQDSIVLCRIDDKITLIKVVDMLDENGKKYYIVRFSTSPENETYKIPVESVMAKAMYQDEFSGKLIDFATSKVGIVLVIIVPSILIILTQIIRLVSSGRNKDDDIEDQVFEHIFPDEIDDINISLDKIPVIKDENDAEDLRPIRAEFDKKVYAAEESVIGVDKNGRAEYSPRSTNGDVLTTSDSFFSSNSSDPGDLSFSRPQNTADDSPITGFVNDPVKISDSGDKENAAEDHKPALSNVLPNSLYNLNTPASPELSEEPDIKESKKKRTVEDIPHLPPVEFYDSDNAAEVIAPNDNDRPLLDTNSIPENAVPPREAIAPKKKKSSKKTIEELMNIIDNEQKKIKKD